MTRPNRPTRNLPNLSNYTAKNFVNGTNDPDNESKDFSESLQNETSRIIQKKKRINIGTHNQNTTDKTSKNINIATVVVTTFQFKEKSAEKSKDLLEEADNNVVVNIGVIAASVIWFKLIRWVVIKNKRKDELILITTAKRPSWQLLKESKGLYEVRLVKPEPEGATPPPAPSNISIISEVGSSPSEPKSLSWGAGAGIAEATVANAATARKMDRKSIFV